MNPEEEEEEDYEPAFVDASAADVTVHLDLNETDEPPPPDDDDDDDDLDEEEDCLLYTSPSPRDMRRSRMPSSA